MDQKIKPGDTRYTAGGLVCKVIAVAGKKVIFRVVKPDGDGLTSEASLGRFLETFTPEKPDLDSPTYKLRQQIGRLNTYVKGMTKDNWRDMRKHCECQLDELVAEFDKLTKG